MSCIQYSTNSTPIKQRILCLYFISSEQFLPIMKNLSARYYRQSVEDKLGIYKFTRFCVRILCPVSCVFVLCPIPCDLCPASCVLCFREKVRNFQFQGGSVSCSLCSVSCVLCHVFCLLRPTSSVLCLSEKKLGISNFSEPLCPAGVLEAKSSVSRKHQFVTRDTPTRLLSQKLDFLS